MPYSTVAWQSSIPPERAGWRTIQTCRAFWSGTELSSFGSIPSRIVRAPEEADGDAAFVARALGDIARAKGMSQVACFAGPVRERIFRLGERFRSQHRTLVEAIEALRRPTPVEPRALLPQPQEPGGGPVDAVRQLRKRQHGRRMCHAEQLQERPRTVEERTRIVRIEPPFVARAVERRPPPVGSRRRSDRLEAVEPGTRRREFVHQHLVHERPHLLERQQRHVFGDVDPFLHDRAVEQHHVGSAIQPVRQRRRIFLPGGNEKRMQLARRFPEAVARVLGGPRYQSRSQVRRRGRPSGVQVLVAWHRTRLLPGSRMSYDPPGALKRPIPVSAHVNRAPFCHRQRASQVLAVVVPGGTLPRCECQLGLRRVPGRRGPVAEQPVA